MAISIPKGFRFGGMYCGVKRDARRNDLALIVSDAPAVAAGVYTQNLVCAAPVTLDRSRTPSNRIRAVAVNSGNANACTGERGLRDAEQMGRVAAQCCGAAADQALVLSTGVIGEFLPLDKITKGLQELSGKLGCDEAAVIQAARGMLTTDTVHKLVSRSVVLGGTPISILGLAKGAAMIGPNMATMLGVIMTDAQLEPAVAQTLLAHAADESFNCISVEGHTSTNDTVLLLANGQAGRPPLTDDEELAHFGQVLDEVCIELARSIPADGEGATHLITIEVTGCATRQDARIIAKTIANSPLVKTAITGADPNWGRIVSAAGYSGVRFDPAKVDLKVNGFQLYRAGAPVSFDAQLVSRSIQEHRDTSIAISFGEGTAEARFWTTDLTAEYVRLNADYHT